MGGNFSAGISQQLAHGIAALSALGKIACAEPLTDLQAIQGNNLHTNRKSVISPANACIKMGGWNSNKGVHGMVPIWMPAETTFIQAGMTDISPTWTSASWEKLLHLDSTSTQRANDGDCQRIITPRQHRTATQHSSLHLLQDVQAMAATEWTDKP